ncbi:MAG: hypothetical protein JXR83_04125 [Deltaproteobacteria bacterium]|nr:hypothetical protein [Deltaproteobacteria bacterium]
MLDETITKVEAPAIAGTEQGDITIAFRDATAADLRFSDYQPGTGWNWYPVDTVGNVGLDPRLAIDSAGNRWVVERKSDNTLQLLVRSAAGVNQTRPIAEAGTANIRRIGFAFDDADRQYLLFVDGFMYLGERTPSATEVLAPPFDVRPAYGDSNPAWPELFYDRTSQTMFGTFVANGRPAIGFLDERLGFVNILTMERNNDACHDIGLGTLSHEDCTADKPVALAIDSAGGFDLCTHIMHYDGDYRVVFLFDGGPNFTGGVIYGNSQPDSYSPGARCSIVVDRDDVAHLFFAQTQSGRNFIHSRVTRSGATFQHAERTVVAGDTGHWPATYVDANGGLHLAYVKVTNSTPRSNYYDSITSSSLVYATLVWDD